MADFELDTQVVVKEMPTLLGVGRVIETPQYSATPGLTWARFKGGTIAAFTPGELQKLSEWIVQHHSPSVTGRLVHHEPPKPQSVAKPSFELVNPPSTYAHFAGSTNCGPDCCEAR